MDKTQIELNYFNFKAEPGKEKSNRISQYVGNIFVSVITYYTGQDYIKQAYISLLNQTFPHWEWLIVTNKIDETLKNLKKIDKRIKQAIDYNAKEIIISKNTYKNLDKETIELLKSHKIRLTFKKYR